MFTKNPNYWVKGKPYVDSLKITSIDDNTARLNALLSGQIDAMAQLPTQQAKAHEATGDIKVLVAPSPQAMMFYMDTTKAPFTDPRVTLAIKLIADRKALVESAIIGYGTVGNDIFGAGLPFYDKSLPQREQDIDKAKSLLKAAGQSDLKVAAEHVADLPRLRRGGDAARAAGQAGRRHDQPQAGAAELVLQPVAPVPEDAVRRDAVADLVAQVLLPAGARLGRARTTRRTGSRSRGTTCSSKAIAEPNKAKAQSYWNQVQKIQYDQGGYLNWTNADWVDGLSKKVQGLKPSAAGVARQLPLPRRLAV